MDLSFIIPAYNEEEHIASTIQSIRSSVDASSIRVGRLFSYEIIVVDNGSKDQTSLVCRQMGVLPIESLATTIGALRNVGARSASGSVLVFLDADITLLPDWSECFPEVFKMLIESPSNISGSKVLPADPATFLSRVWFQENKKDLGYMNSAHLLIHRDFFAKLSGFDESLVSGEDSDLSRRAIILGGSIRPVSGLKVIHHGSPSNLWEFFRRERWHGHGDFQSWEILRKSRPSHLAIANLIAMITAVVGSIFVSPWGLAMYPLALGCLSGASAFHRVGYKLEKRVGPLILLYAIYIMARTFSLFDRVTSTRPGRWR